MLGNNGNGDPGPETSGHLAQVKTKHGGKHKYCPSDLAQPKHRPEYALGDHEFWPIEMTSTECSNITDSDMSMPSVPRFQLNVGTE